MSSIRWSAGWESYRGFDPRRRDLPEGLSKMMMVSLAIHLLLFSFLFLSRPLWGIRASNLQAYQVTLVAKDETPPLSAPSPPAAAPSKAPLPKEAPAAPKAPLTRGVPRVQDDPERLQEWWKKKVGSLQIAPVPRKNAPAPPQPAPRLDLTRPAPPAASRPAPLQREASVAPPPASANSARKEATESPSIIATGTASPDQALFKFPYYLKSVENKISGEWTVPPIDFEEGGAAAVVLFYLHRTGKIAKAEIEKSSGNPFFDQAALRAVYAANPLPPFPDDLTEDPLKIHFSFAVKKGS